MESGLVSDSVVVGSLAISGVGSLAISGIASLLFSGSVDRLLVLISAIVSLSLPVTQIRVRQ